MAQSGCFEIDLGIESGDAEIQKYIRKNLNLKRTIEMVASIRHQGMVCKAFFMLGFPEETHTQIAETINFAIELKRSGLSDVAFFPVMPFPGTEISAVTGKVVFQGAIIDDVYTHERSFSAHRLRKYSAKPEISLNERFTPDGLRLLGKFAYGRFELSTEVKDLKSELDRFVQLEESALYGV
jgi:hypothetical protein